MQKLHRIKHIALRLVVHLGRQFLYPYVISHGSRSRCSRSARGGHGRGGGIDGSVASHEVGYQILKGSGGQRF